MEMFRCGSVAPARPCLALLVTRPSSRPSKGDTTAPPLAPECTAAVVSSISTSVGWLARHTTEDITPGVTKGAGR